MIDTDYDNYAIHYSCREIDYDGTCLDGYSFVFSRHPEGLRPEDQKIVTQKKQEICFLGKYRRVPHTGEALRPVRHTHTEIHSHAFTHTHTCIHMFIK